MRSRWDLVHIEDVEDPSHLPERSAADLGNTRHRRNRRFGLPGGETFGRNGLHNHHAERMGDNVMHLPSDPTPLLDDSALGLHDAQRLGPIRLGPQVGEQFSTRALTVAQRKARHGDATARNELVPAVLAGDGHHSGNHGDKRHRDSEEAHRGRTFDVTAEPVHRDSAREGGAAIDGVARPDRCGGHHTIANTSRGARRRHASGTKSATKIRSRTYHTSDEPSIETP